MSSINKQCSIDIVMTTWGREDMTKLALKALKQNTKIPYRLILIDNGSKRCVQDVYLDNADIYIRMDKNVGLEAAKNLAMNFVESPYFISTDNDILVPKPVDGKCWLERLHDLYMRTDGAGAIALRPQVLVGTGDIFGDNPPEFLEFSHIPGYMRIMDTELTKRLGAWSYKRPLRGHEEYWISERMRELKYKIGWASFIRCWHLFGDDNWGYTIPPEEHGHTPVALPKDDWKAIEELCDITPPQRI